MITDGDSNVVNDILSNTSNPNSCHIVIQSLEQDQIGDWKCRIVHSASQQFQEATLAVTEELRSGL